MNPKEALIHTLRLRKPTSAIFNYPYKACIPQYMVYDEEYRDKYGIYTTDIKSIDEDLHMQPTTVHIPISKMVEVYEANEYLSIDTNESTLQIYDTIQWYLQCWEKMINSMRLNKHSIPIEDLLALDSFADALYPYVNEEKEENRHYLVAGPVFIPLDSKDRISKGKRKSYSDILYEYEMGMSNE